MNTMIHHTAESESDIRCITIETTALEDLFSTTPLKIIGSMYQQPNEDELHSAFEEAISDRVVAFNKQRRSISIPILDSVSLPPSIHTEALLPGSSAHSITQKYGAQEMILLIAVALMLILIGFDLMGLLVLLT